MLTSTGDKSVLGLSLVRNSLIFLLVQRIVFITQMSIIGVPIAKHVTMTGGKKSLVTTDIPYFKCFAWKSINLHI